MAAKRPKALVKGKIAMLMLKKALTIVTLAASLMVLSPVAHAQASSGWLSRIRTWWQNLVAEYQAKQTSGHAVPELDPSAAGSAVVLLVGGVAYIASRRREEEEDAV
jgi:hypothetical protein